MIRIHHQVFLSNFQMRVHIPQAARRKIHSKLKTLVLSPWNHLRIQIFLDTLSIKTKIESENHDPQTN